MPCNGVYNLPQSDGTHTQVVVREGDTEEDLERKVTQASILGTWQATLTRWKETEGGLRSVWRENTAEERLLGVSLTGIMDNPLTSGVVFVKALIILLITIVPAMQSSVRGQGRLRKHCALMQRRRI